MQMSYLYNFIISEGTLLPSPCEVSFLKKKPQNQETKPQTPWLELCKQGRDPWDSSIAKDR